MTKTKGRKASGYKVLTCPTESYGLHTFLFVIFLRNSLMHRVWSNESHLLNVLVYAWILHFSIAVTVYLCVLTHKPLALCLKVYAKTCHSLCKCASLRFFKVKSMHKYQRACCKWSFLILDMYQLFTSLFFLCFII